VLFQRRHLDITGPSLKSDRADRFQRRCYTLLAVWVEDYPEQVIVTQVSYSGCRMCQIPNGAPKRHSTFWPLDSSTDQQPDDLHLLLLGFVKDSLHWLLKYLKSRNVKDQFDNQFTSVPQYPGLQHFSIPFDGLKSGTWQG
jgi:hypothetical protein